MTESNQGPATPGTAARCEVCNREKIAWTGYDNGWQPAEACWRDPRDDDDSTCYRLGYERLKAENASLLEGKERGHRINEKQKAAIAAAEQRAEAAEKALRAADVTLLHILVEHESENADPWPRLRALAQDVARAALHDEERSARVPWCNVHEQPRDLCQPESHPDEFGVVGDDEERSAPPPPTTAAEIEAALGRKIWPDEERSAATPEEENG